MRLSLDFRYRKSVWSCGKGGNHQSQRALDAPVWGLSSPAVFKAGRECVRACRLSAARRSHAGPILVRRSPRRRPPRAGVERTFSRAGMGSRPCRAAESAKTALGARPRPHCGDEQWRGVERACGPPGSGRPSHDGREQAVPRRPGRHKHPLRVPFARRRRGREEWRTRGRMMATGLRSAGNPASATATAARRQDLGPLPVGISYAGIRPAAARRPDRGPLPVGISYGPRPMLPREAPRRHRVSRSTGPLGLNFTISLD